MATLEPRFFKREPEMTPKDTFVIILKRVCVENNDIREAIMNRVLKIATVLCSTGFKEVTREKAEEHYAPMKDSEHFESAISQILPGPIQVFYCEGDRKAMREEIGHTYPSKAKPGTIRADYAKSVEANLIHCSDSQEEAEREFKVWFGDYPIYECFSKKK